jgi:hypothetical protein
MTISTSVVWLVSLEHIDGRSVAGDIPPGADRAIWISAMNKWLGDGIDHLELDRALVEAASAGDA